MKTISRGFYEIRLGYQLIIPYIVATEDLGKGFQNDLNRKALREICILKAIDDQASPWAVRLNVIGCLK